MLGRLKVAAVTFADIDALHRRITASGASYAANCVVALCSRLFSKSGQAGRAEQRIRQTPLCEGRGSPATSHRYAHLYSDPQKAAVERVAAIIDARDVAANGTKPPPAAPIPFVGKRRGSRA